MKGLKQIRMSLGLKHSQLAKFLGVSREMYSLVERGQRTFSNQIMLKYAVILKALETSIEKRAANKLRIKTMHHSPAEADKYLSRKTQCRYSIYLLQAQLEKMSKKFIQTNKLYGMLKEIKNLPGCDPDWLQELNHHTEKKLRLYDEVEQQKLREKIYRLKAEITSIDSLVNKIRSKLKKPSLINIKN